jgi:hypothetical protein
MLALFVGFDQDFEEFLADRDRLSLVADLSLPLRLALVQFLISDRRLTSGILGSFGRRVNIFLTQNLFMLAWTRMARNNVLLPKLSGLHVGGLFVDQNQSNVCSTFCVNQSFVLFLWRQVCNVASDTVSGFRTALIMQTYRLINSSKSFTSG